MKRQAFKRKIKRSYYEIKAAYSKLIRSERWFMNYGYFGETAIDLMEEDEKYRYHIQLYDRILQSVSLTGKNVLEVSCGKGGGSYYFMKYHKPASIVGIDLAKNNINFCKAFCGFPNMEFYAAGAESFDLHSRSFDVVLNLEASHNYSDKESFYKRVRKHLVAGGYFILADIMASDKIEHAEAAIVSLGFTVEKFENISVGAMRSMEYNSKIWYPLSHRFPFLIPGFIKSYQASTESPVYKNLSSGKTKYVSYVFKKNG